MNELQRLVWAERHSMSVKWTWNKLTPADYVHSAVRWLRVFLVSHKSHGKVEGFEGQHREKLASKPFSFSI